MSSPKSLKTEISQETKGSYSDGFRLNKCVCCLHVVLVDNKRETRQFQAAGSCDRQMCLAVAEPKWGIFFFSRKICRPNSEHRHSLAQLWPGVAFSMARVKRSGQGTLLAIILLDVSKETGSKLAAMKRQQWVASSFTSATAGATQLTNHSCCIQAASSQTILWLNCCVTTCSTAVI